MVNSFQMAYETTPDLSNGVMCRKSVSFEELKYLDTAFTSSSKPRVVNIGIRKWWVSGNHRQKGIATKILDCIRSNFIFAVVGCSKRNGCVFGSHD